VNNTMGRPPPPLQDPVHAPVPPCRNRRSYWSGGFRACTACRRRTSSGVTVPRSSGSSRDTKKAPDLVFHPSGASRSPHVGRGHVRTETPGLHWRDGHSDDGTGGDRTQQPATPVGPARRGGGQQLIGKPPQVDDARPDTEAAHRDLGTACRPLWLRCGETGPVPPSTVFATYNRYRDKEHAGVALCGPRRRTRNRAAYATEPDQGPGPAVTPDAT